MCGIIGIVGKPCRPEVTPLLIEGLKRLEYRGYDSAGVATLVNGKIQCRRSEGKLANLIERLAMDPVSGCIGIAHTRWATHGAPSEINAHPIATPRVAVVHNGIIENFSELKAELATAGYVFGTQTDTEAVAVLVTRHLDEGLSPKEAVARALPLLHGVFALVVLFAGERDLLICARRGAPLTVGFGDGEMFVGSDALALAPLTRRLVYLEEGDWAVVTSSGATIYDAAGEEVRREIKITAHTGAHIGKAGHPHFMKKEIFDQPAAIGDTLRAFSNPTTRSIVLPSLPIALADISRVTIVGCGTSFHAGLVAKYWIDRLARIPVEVDIASEFRYREPEMPNGGLAVFISQSGETADTLAALRYARAQKQLILSVVNQAESSIARESHAVLATHAGPEIGVASTKAFTTQLTVLGCFAIALARARGKITAEREAALCNALAEVPERAADLLMHDDRVARVARDLANSRDVLYLGRGTAYPLALEGALKLKETSYIHAEGYAAGEMKHGPIALVDDGVPVVVLAPADELIGKTLSNVQEILARGGRVVMISDKAGLDRVGERLAHGIEVPRCDPFVAPLLYSIPVQLLAYYVAVQKGTDVDQPRNLAKSVTVE
jgi:glucosamine--fructose-6-phosphate aminotransferase (isomerizing)